MSSGRVSHSRPSLMKRTLKFQSTGDMESCIQQCQALRDRLVQKFDRSVALGTNTVAVAIKDDQLAEKVYQRLFPSVDSSDNYNAARKEYQKGTCTWFTNRKQFDDWRMQADVLLWVYGKAGCGKTILW